MFCCDDGRGSDRGFNGNVSDSMIFNQLFDYKYTADDDPNIVYFFAKATTIQYNTIQYKHNYYYSGINPVEL